MKFVDARLNEYFKRSEFMCPCGCQRAGVDYVLLNRLTNLRIDSGVPVIITEGGGFRCEAYQKKVNPAARDSFHQSGGAADHYVKGVSVKEVFTWWEETYPDNGLHLYPAQGFVHADVRGYKARW